MPVASVPVSLAVQAFSSRLPSHAGSLALVTLWTRPRRVSVAAGWPMSASVALHSLPDSSGFSAAAGEALE